jgi:S-adenosylmethionine:tRNA ribosyltransferase-isomerase
VLETLKLAGVEVAALTLHVGIGTFQPIRVEEIESHRMLPEWCRVPPEVADAIRRARARQGRVVAVGTTVTRTLESHAAPEGLVRPGAGPCDLFIHPGFRFQVVDALLTNFHLPRSTPLLLACAFAGREAILAAYEEAIARRYRFFSYGDSMLLADLPRDAA